jgi:methionine synthase II (cobalamin-independent)
MAYDPTAETGIPTEPVGSLPRPDKLQAAYAEYDAGKIDKQQLEAEQEAAAKDSIERGEATGAPIISDGEQWWSSFATYPVTDTLAGTGLADHLGPGGQYFAIFADGHYRQLPKLVGGPFRYKTFAADTLKRSIKLASKPMKQAVIAPSMLALLYPLDEEISGYSREQFESDLVDECEKDIRGAFDAGAVRVSIDFTEGRLALREDSRNPWTGRGMLPHFVALINGVLDRFTPEERANIGVHTCPGGDRDSVHSADVPYSALLPSLFELNAGYFMMQCRSERDRESVYKLVGEHSRDDANGVPQVVFVGVINPQNPRVESAQEVCDELVAAAKHIPTERLGATDDCGFSPFSIDEKPLHGSADYARDIAFQKIENRVQGTKMAAEKLGVHVPAPA